VFSASSQPEAPAGARFGLATFASATGIMVMLTLVASALNYASNIIFGRLLSPASYGDLTALLALLVIVTVPTGAAQTIIAERIAAYRAAGDEHTVRYLIRHSAAHIAVVSVVVGAVFAAAVPLVQDVLDLQAPGPAIALVGLIGVSFFYPFVLGVLQGLDRFVAVGLVMLGVAVGRIAFGVPWVLAGGGSGGAIAGQALGVTAAVLISLYALRGYHLERGTGAATAGVTRKPDARAAAASAAFIGFALISNLDVVLAKAFLDADGAGRYAALVTVEKMILFLPGAVALVMVPAAARARIEVGSAGHVLRWSALIVAGVTMLVAIPAMIEPERVIETMFGEEYGDAASGVLPIAAAGAALALLNLLVIYTVAIEDHRWVWLLVGGVCLQAGAISAFHDSATEVATAQAAATVFTLVLNELLFHPLLRGWRSTT
jgi:O-antigen/teichoic acid export membrane protein